MEPEDFIPDALTSLPNNSVQEINAYVRHHLKASGVVRVQLLKDPFLKGVLPEITVQGTMAEVHVPPNWLELLPNQESQKASLLPAITQISQQKQIQEALSDDRLSNMKIGAGLGATMGAVGAVSAIAREAEDPEKISRANMLRRTGQIVATAAGSSVGGSLMGLLYASSKETERRAEYLASRIYDQLQAVQPAPSVDTLIETFGTLKDEIPSREEQKLLIALTEALEPYREKEVEQATTSHEKKPHSHVANLGQRPATTTREGFLKMLRLKGGGSGHSIG